MLTRYRLHFLVVFLLGSLAGAVLLDPVARAALTSQVNTYVNGNVLTANQLNSEFGNIYSTINNLDNANLSDSANISPAKISASIDGTAISRDGGTGALSVAVDNVGIETNSDQIRLKDLGVTSAKLAADAVVTSKIIDNAVTNPKLAINAVSSSKIADGTIVEVDLDNGAVTSAKILDNTIAADDISTTILYRSGAGTSTSAAYGFTGDTDTGFYSPASNSVGLIAGGGNQVVWTTTGQAFYQSGVSQGEAKWKIFTGTLAGSTTSSDFTVPTGILLSASGYSGTSKTTIGPNLGAANALYFVAGSAAESVRIHNSQVTPHSYRLVVMYQ